MDVLFRPSPRQGRKIAELLYPLKKDKKKYESFLRSRGLPINGTNKVLKQWKKVVEHSQSFLELDAIDAFKPNHPLMIFNSELSKYSKSLEMNASQILLNVVLLPLKTVVFIHLK